MSHEPLWTFGVAILLAMGLAVPALADQHETNESANESTNVSNNSTAPPEDPAPPGDGDADERTVVPWIALVIGLAVFFAAVVFSRRE